MRCVREKCIPVTSRPIALHVDLGTDGTLVRNLQCERQRAHWNGIQEKANLYVTGATCGFSGQIGNELHRSGFAPPNEILRWFSNSKTWCFQNHIYALSKRNLSCKRGYA